MSKQPNNMAEVFDFMRSDYNAAKQTQFQRRRTGLQLSGSSADYHYRCESNYLRMLEFARDMDRNDMIIGQAITRAVDNTIRDGIQPDSQTGDDKLDEMLDARWREWSSDPELCDITGEMAWPEIQHCVLRQKHVDGDIVVLPTRDGSLQLIEAHRLRTPRNTTKNVVHGVLLDDRRKRQQYWFCPDDIDPNMPLLKVSEITPVDVRDDAGNRQLFHVYDPKRATQTRGVTSLAPVFDTAGMFEDINFARLIQQQIVSCFAFIRERTEDYQGTNAPTATGEVRTETRRDGSSRIISGIGPGMEIKGEVGEKLTGFSPDVPSPQFFEHMRLVLTIIGINLGLPLVVMLLDASETNFSGFRGAVDQAKLGFVRLQNLMIERLCKPVRHWKVRQWMAEDAGMRAIARHQGIDIFGHTWTRPKWPYLEPLKDAQAVAFRISNGLTSPRRAMAENEGDYFQLTDERVYDNAYLIRSCKAEAAKINKEFVEEPVSWRDIMDPTSYRDLPAAIDTTDKEETQNTGQRPKEEDVARDS